MIPLIDRALPDGRSVAQIVFGAADRQGLTLNFVDVGARNGNYMLPVSYAKRSKLIGFEPNRVEYEKLVNGTTDARAAGMVEPPFRAKAYQPYALWSENTDRALYLTAGAGAVTLMGPASERMTSNMWREQDRGQNYYDRVQRVVGTDQVPCVTLDHIWSDHGNTIDGKAIDDKTIDDRTIDILKLDAEGSELEILKGAVGLLGDKRVLLIFSEFLLLPFYERRVTLGHQQVFLDDLGYRLISLDHNHYVYNWRKTNIRSRNDRWMSYAGDAVFVLDPDRNSIGSDEMYRLGLACMAIGFNGFGLNLMREAGMVSSSDVDAIAAEANRPSLARRLRLAWMDFPFIVERRLSALRRRFAR
jgi:FkbM family methyltransferase